MGEGLSHPSSPFPDKDTEVQENQRVWPKGSQGHNRTRTPGSCCPHPLGWATGHTNPGACCPLEARRTAPKWLLSWTLVRGRIPAGDSASSFSSWMLISKALLSCPCLASVSGQPWPGKMNLEMFPPQVFLCSKIVVLFPSSWSLEPTRSTITTY